MFSIGEFSKITGLTVKTLRFYHEQGILHPTSVDPGSGYRFYGPTKVEVARVILTLRELGFSISEIAEILGEHEEDADIVGFLERRRAELQERMRSDRQTVKRLDAILIHQREATMSTTASETGIEQKTIEPMTIARIRMTGKYSDCGPKFGLIGRKFGRHISGPGMMLQHDGEYREHDATFDVAMPVKGGTSTDDILVEELPGGPAIALLHVGPYEELGRTYEKLLAYAKENELEYTLPTREVYHKGPGMIFRGNPKKYRTEVQLMIAE